MVDVIQSKVCFLFLVSMKDKKGSKTKATVMGNTIQCLKMKTCYLCVNYLGCKIQLNMKEFMVNRLTPGVSVFQLV